MLLIAQSAHAQALTELLKAAEEGDLRRVSFYLDRGMDPNSSDADGNTILMMAARQGHASVTSLIVSRKASVSRQTRAGDTALMMASLGGHLPVVKLLVQAGAPMGGAAWQPLHYAAFGGSADTVRFLLDRGANKNALAPNAYTPLMLAIRNGHVDAAKVLLHEHPDLAQRGMAGETALDIARRREDQGLVELLKGAGAVD
jgi:hypothetical protein